MCWFACVEQTALQPVNAPQQQGRPGVQLTYKLKPRLSVKLMFSKATLTPMQAQARECLHQLAITPCSIASRTAIENVMYSRSVQSIYAVT